MPDDVLKRLGRRMQAARKDCGFTQDELSAASGVSVRHIAKIEKGVMNPSFEILIQLVTVLGISLDSLIELDAMEDADVQELLNLYRAGPEEERPLVKATLRTMVQTLRKKDKDSV